MKCSVEHAPGSTHLASDLAPVVVFAYARLDHIQRTIESLRLNAEAACTELHVYCDAAKSPSVQARVDAVRDYVASIDGFRSVQRIYRDCNLGLARSIIDGVSSLLDRHDRVIVVEDDLLLSPHFLRYMNEALALYADDPSVASIHGYSYPAGPTLPETYFLRGADCWGWATWRRAWPLFRADGAALLAELRERGLSRRFDLDGSFAFTHMLEQQVAGRNDSWAIRWHASCFLAGHLTLYPGRSLVHNIGNDDSGTHASRTSMFGSTVAAEPVPVRRQPLIESEAARAAIVSYLQACRPGPARRFAAWLRRRIGAAARRPVQ